ncbi:GntR family transcriptional regulator [Kroppenstedtia pulmonis]|uniref:GntR family transcriptional regulator n=1 Tax=Kroppenstedtia pulmonis TaxID=1380685 RepID=A0A7D4BFT5_9BACL|nr:GntR family transcriptional regulator [Kroppenstedtia pulmonis]QKG83015.1 GntR family transcriptional regulator [Kroppenstedtia pulmonis]
MRRLPIEISSDDPSPIYRQIENQLRNLILSEILPAGTSLPSIRSLSKDLGCSVITTRRAYQELENEGLIMTRQGLGTFVAEVETNLWQDHRSDTMRSHFQEAIAEGLRLDFSKEELTDLFMDELEAVFRKKRS